MLLKFFWHEQPREIVFPVYSQCVIGFQTENVLNRLREFSVSILQSAETVI